MTLCHFLDTLLKKSDKKVVLRRAIKSFIRFVKGFFAYYDSYMSMENNFQFKGFIPNKAIKKQSQFFYSLIESRSPSDSKKTASLTKKGNLYEARLKISSATACSFEISSKKDKISDTMKCLQRQFFDKIINWNKTRSQKYSLLK